MIPKNPDRYYDEKYKVLLKDENKPLFEFYEFYKKHMERLNSMVDFRISQNFVANIRKDIVNIIDALNNFILLISNQYARQSTFLIFYNLVLFFLRKHQYPLCSLCHP